MRNFNNAQVDSHCSDRIVVVVVVGALVSRRVVVASYSLHTHG